MISHSIPYADESCLQGCSKACGTPRDRDIRGIRAINGVIAMAVAAGAAAQGWGARDVAWFMSTITNKIDAKGRLSVPAPFRKVLAVESNPVLLCFPSPKCAAIEACGQSRIDRISQSFDDLPAFDPRRAAIEARFFAEIAPIEIDGDGRIILPDSFKSFAGITDIATFVGMRDHFMIWNPAAYEAWKTQSRADADQLLMRLGAKPGGGAA